MTKTNKKSSSMVDKFKSIIVHLCIFMALAVLTIYTQAINFTEMGRNEFSLGMLTVSFFVFAIYSIIILLIALIMNRKKQYLRKPKVVSIIVIGLALLLGLINLICTLTNFTEFNAIHIWMYIDCFIISIFMFIIGRQKDTSFEEVAINETMTKE